MTKITKLSQISEHLNKTGKLAKVAVAVAEDANTISSINQAVGEGWLHAILHGNRDKIVALCESESIDHTRFEIVDHADETEATLAATAMVKQDAADILMKGLVGTDKFLRSVLDKEKGLLPPKAVMSYTCALEIPAYDKLLFVSDTAVLTYPDLNQKKAMVEYSVKMAHKFGIKTPKVALISATEKVGAAMPNTFDDAQLCKMNERGQIKNCVIDGPLDIFLACDPEATKIKQTPNLIEGEADILIFPNLESANSFYKGVMLFAKAELAGLIQGTSKPVVVMSRSESALSKFYCIALAALMAGES
ncbi:MAG: phosphate acyltransferase [Candidatus Cloacimonadaceae bacterium]|jgi:phosphate butyryltransferase